MKKIKLIIFICLIFLLILVLFYGIFGINLSFKSIDKIKEKREYKDFFSENIKVNGVDLLYDKNTNIYYYTISQDYENKNYIFKLVLDNKYKYKIVDKKINIINVDYNDIIDVIIYNKKNYYNIKIQLTNLPLVNITSESEITTENQNTVFTYINNGIKENYFSKNSKIKVRGATSQKLDKKSYRVNFYNKFYTKEEKVMISNFYLGDSLILDALYRDSSKIRNLLSTELWNSISKDFSNVNIYSEFVEVFINNEYKGLYLLTEPVNRSKFNLNKNSNNDTGFIVKSTLGVLEVKYPNETEFIPMVEEKVIEIISNYMKTKTDSSFETINNTFDLTNYVDIIIFNYFINNIDNRLDQNVYYYNNSLNEDVLYVQPWDMEWSFGIIPGSEFRDAKYFDCLINHPNAKEINEMIIKRYWELRKNILTEEYFDYYISRYLYELNKGATQRDSLKWVEYDIELELEKIKLWIKDRIKYVDEYIKGIEND